MELIKIRNTGDKPLTLPHDGKGTVTIDAGAERILPSDYATIFFGHPGVKNDTRERARDQEYKQLLTMWSVYPGLNDDERDELLPSFECYDLDDNRVYCILDDPDGSLSTSNTTLRAVDDDEATLQAQVDALQAQIDKLTNLLSRENVAATPSTPAAAPAVAAQVSDGTAQATRNEQRDDIPKAPRSTARAKADKPRTPRAGSR